MWGWSTTYVRRLAAEGAIVARQVDGRGRWRGCGQRNSGPRYRNLVGQGDRHAHTRPLRPQVIRRPGRVGSPPSTVRQAELDALVAELDAIGDRQRAAERRGDEAAILAAIARERVLPALIRSARIRLNAAETAEVEAAMAAVTPGAARQP